jgi:phosphatidylserine synthase
MSITALFATSGATNAGLYPAAGLCDHMVEIDQFPPTMAARLGDRVPMGLAVTAGVAGVLVLLFDLSSIASIGSTIALLVFALVTVAHLRARHETGARLSILVAALGCTVAVLATFTITTLIHEPATLITLAVIVAVSVALERDWKRRRRAA